MMNKTEATASEYDEITKFQRAYVCLAVEQSEKIRVDE